MQRNEPPPQWSAMRWKRADPIITYLGTHMAGIIGGASIVETIFAIPGSEATRSRVCSRRITMVQAYVLFSGCIYVLTNILIDLIYIALDPKIRAERRWNHE